MNRKQAQNVVALLQSDPLYYRHFGWTWWWVKRALRALGFGLDHTPVLGDNDCHDCDGYYADLEDTDLEDVAWRLQYQNATEGHWHEPQGTTPDGELYLLFDDDAE